MFFLGISEFTYRRYGIEIVLIRSGLMKKTKSTSRQIIGWREWISLPDFGIDWIKAKIDTGARTSTLHAFDVEPVTVDGVRCVKFNVHPRQRHKKPEVECVAPLVEERAIKNSGGKTEMRYVIATRLRIGEWEQDIELTLTNRDEMTFRMLIGRAAIRKHYIVNPGASYRAGHKKPRQKKKRPAQKNIRPRNKHKLST